MRLRRRRALKLRGPGLLTSLALPVGVILCTLATVAASDDLVRTTSATHLPGVLLTLSLLAAVVQMRK